MPRDVALIMARDVEAVAIPILSVSRVLTDADLVEIIRTGTDDVAMPAAATGTDYSHLDIPAVMRGRGGRTASSAVEAMRANGVETLDIPAFLRKQAD